MQNVTTVNAPEMGAVSMSTPAQAPAPVQAQASAPTQAMAPAQPMAPAPVPAMAPAPVPAMAPAPVQATDDLFSAISQDAGQGLEQIDSQSLSIPYIYIAQAMSPIVQDGKAQMGQFVNSVTNEVYDTLRFIPCHFVRRYQAYNKQSGDYVGSFTPFEIEGHQLPGIYSDLGRYGLRQQTADGHFIDCELNDTRLHYIVYQTVNGSWEPAIISLSRTQIKASKRLLSMAKTFELRTPTGVAIHNPPSFSCIYEASRIIESNEKGRWFSWMFSRIGPVTDKELYFKCRDLYTSVKNEPVSDDSPNNKESSAFQAQQQANTWANPVQAQAPAGMSAGAPVQQFPTPDQAAYTGYRQQQPQPQLSPYATQYAAPQAGYDQEDVPF